MNAAIDIEDADPTPATKRFGKKAIIIAVAVVLLVLVAGVAAWFLLRAPATEGVDAGTGEETVYVEVPSVVVNLRSADGAARLIKLRVMLVPATPDDVAVITARLPLVIDSFQPFLRELRPEDLAGAAAVFRIKEELLLRANEAAGKGKVKNVLIQDLIEQ